MTTLGNKKRRQSAWSKRIAVLAGALFIGGASLGGPPSLTLGEVGNVSSVSVSYTHLTLPTIYSV